MNDKLDKLITALKETAYAMTAKEQGVNDYDMFDLNYDDVYRYGTDDGQILIARGILTGMGIAFNTHKEKV